MGQAWLSFGGSCFLPLGVDTVCGGYGVWHTGLDIYKQAGARGKEKGQQDILYFDDCFAAYNRFVIL